MKSPPTREVVELVEWQSLDLPGRHLTSIDRPLTSSLGSYEEGRLFVEDFQSGLRITATSWVGVVRFSEFEVRVIPKLAGHNIRLIEMIQMTTGLDALRRCPGVFNLHADGDHLLDLIALMLAEECERILRAGLLADYVEEEDAAIRQNIRSGDKAIREAVWVGPVANPDTTQRQWIAVVSQMTFDNLPRCSMRLCSSVVALSLLHTMLGMLSAADQAPPAHTWTTIAYPPLPSMPEGTITPSLSLDHPDEDGFQFVLTYYVARNSDEPRPKKPAADKITVRLHLPDGKVVDPNVDALRGGVGFGDSRGATYHYPYKFPWSRNVLEEAWIELRLPERTFWVEVPYGFLRNPTAAQTPLEARSGPPKLAAKMTDLDRKDSIVPWHHVLYDLGPIQNNWHLSVNLANPFDAQAEIVLYRDDIQVGKSMYLWDLHSPRTTIQIKQPGDAVLKSRCISLRLHEDGMRRSDSFKFNRNPGEDERCWGTAAIKVDDKSYEFLVPSSLFKYVHGVADPYHKALVPRGRD